MILLVDGNNLAHRVFRKFSTLRGGPSHLPTSIVFGFPYVLRTMINKFNATSCIAVFDRGKSSFRKDLLPTYKQREPKEDFDYEDFVRQLGLVKPLLRALGVSTFAKKGYEADDFIARLVFSSMKWDTEDIPPWDDITIISSDKDYNQLLLHKKIQIFNPFKEATITVHSCKHHFGYEPYQCVDFLSLTGDDSDKIPGIPGIGPKRAMAFLDKWGSINSWLRSGELVWNQLNKLHHQETLELNQKLIDLLYFQTKVPQPKLLKYVKGRFNPVKVRELGSYYNIRTFNNDFLAPYKSLR